MSKTVRARHIIALVAAYVVALQALLLPLSVAAASPFKTSLCAAAMSANGAPSPASHDSGCPCAAGCGMQCCAQTFVGPPQFTVTRGATRAVSMTRAPAIESVIRLADRTPQIPRAPPVA
ncbi:MAG: hypothetical protein ABSF41_03945 [Pseudolabrys sp.]|jgi:hypothetical protein